ncbi:MAG: glycosyltransferase [Planctomycetota bacterium]
MSQSPRVSVVMSVYNGGSMLGPTLESIAAQTERDFEFIIVDDGSSDASPEVLRSFAGRDPRAVIITQANAGLTAALAAGCDRAKGEYIARQDVGDRSLPNRFARQIAYLDEHPEVVAVGGGCRRIGPGGEFLGEACRQLEPSQVTQSFLADGVGLSHTVAMFRREAFEKAGGYRTQFRFAQDTDLWHRLIRLGSLAEINEVLFEWGIDIDGISSASHARQRLLASLARESYDATSRGESDSAILERAEQASWGELSVSDSIPRNVALATAEHFIGSQLFAHGDHRCRPYLIRAIRHRPFWLRPWAKLALSFARTKKLVECQNR